MVSVTLLRELLSENSGTITERIVDLLFSEHLVRDYPLSPPTAENSEICT